MSGNSNIWYSSSVFAGCFAGSPSCCLLPYVPCCFSLWAANCYWKIIFQRHHTPSAPNEGPSQRKGLHQLKKALKGVSLMNSRLKISWTIQSDVSGIQICVYNLSGRGFLSFFPSWFAQSQGILYLGPVRRKNGSSCHESVALCGLS